MKKLIILPKTHGEQMWMVSDGDNVVAWFDSKENAKEWIGIKNGSLHVVRSHELTRIKENIDRIFDGFSNSY